MVEWSELRGIPYKTLADRIRAGWEPERALTAPIKKVGHAA
jgi:hypothetical protein